MNFFLKFLFFFWINFQMQIYTWFRLINEHLAYTICGYIASLLREAENSCKVEKWANTSQLKSD